MTESIAAKVTFRLKTDDKKRRGLRGETWVLGKEHGLIPSILAVMMVERIFQFWFDSCSVDDRAAESELAELKAYVETLEYHKETIKAQVPLAAQEVRLNA